MLIDLNKSSAVFSFSQIRAAQPLVVKDKVSNLLTSHSKLFTTLIIRQKEKADCFGTFNVLYAH